MGLLADFKTAAVSRARFPDNERLTAPAIFALVRDMPFEAASDNRPETVIAEWRATGFGKHLLLQTLYEEFGMGAMLICALHEFRPEVLPWLPEELRAQLDPPIRDVTAFLRLHASDDWMTMDATWPLATALLGLPVNDRYEVGHEMTIASDPDEILHVPPDADPLEFEQRLIAGHIGSDLERRNRFVAGLSAWLAQRTAEAASHTEAAR